MPSGLWSKPVAVPIFRAAPSQTLPRFRLTEEESNACSIRRRAHHLPPQLQEHRSNSNTHRRNQSPALLNSLSPSITKAAGCNVSSEASPPARNELRSVRLLTKTARPPPKPPPDKSDGVWQPGFHLRHRFVHHARLRFGLGNCPVIGNRRFHHNPEAVAHLALALQKVWQKAVWNPAANIFPDTDLSKETATGLAGRQAQPVELEAADLAPSTLWAAKSMAALLPARRLSTSGHKPAGFRIRLKQILRRDIGFKGVIFSDDLTMEGACGVGGLKERARIYFEAGCDIVLVCNRPDLVDELREDFRILTIPLWRNVGNIGPTRPAVPPRKPLCRRRISKKAQAVVANLASPQDTAGGVKSAKPFKQAAFQQSADFINRLSGKGNDFFGQVKVILLNYLKIMMIINTVFKHTPLNPPDTRQKAKRYRHAVFFAL